MTTEDHLKRLRETGQIDGLVGAKEVGRLLDFHNNAVTKKKEKHHSNEMNARNRYFYKLWVLAIEAAKSGENKPVLGKEEKIHT